MNDILDIYAKTIGSINANFLISGASGSLGLSTLNILNRIAYIYSCQLRIYIIVRANTKIENFDAFKYIKINLISLNEVEKIKDHIDYALIMGASSDPKSIMQDPINTLLEPIDILHIILKSSNLVKSKFIYISSGEVYGNLDKDFLLEDDYSIINVNNIRSSYPISKMVCENLCETYRHNGLDIITLRVCHIFGNNKKNDSRITSYCMDMATLNKPIVLTTKGLQVRSFIYVYDVVNIIFFMLSLKNRKYNIYNVSDNDYCMSIFDFANICSQYNKVDLIFNLKHEKQNNLVRSRACLNNKRLLSEGFNFINLLENKIRIELEHKVSNYR